MTLPPPTVIMQPPVIAMPPSVISSRSTGSFRSSSLSSSRSPPLQYRHRSPSPSPSLHLVNSINLVSTENSTITAVSVYSGRAEITRIFKFNVETGQNHVVINGLPDDLDQNSIRVEGRGAATIHDVTTSWMECPPTPRTSPAISDLNNKKKNTTKALKRCKTAIASLEAYLSTMNVKTIDVAQVRQVVKEYDTTAEELDNRVLELEAQLQEIKEKLDEEHANLRPKTNDHLGKRAIISIFADVEGEVELVLNYAVYGATWTAGYDIRVDTSTDKEPVTLVYKAAITQRTGEDWSDVSLTLETAIPTFGVGVPTLDPWSLSIYKPPQFSPVVAHYPSLPASMLPAPMMVPPSRSRSRSMTPPIIDHRTFDVMSKGNVSATFQVPGLITIPSDGVAHDVTIIQSKLEATLSWICVPKKDTRTHLSARIKNASQYTLLSGTGSIYVDGSFISRSQVPAVSPEESFDCPLGLDPSIRITYHPLTKKQSKSGFYTKSITHVFTQAVTLHNTKFTPVERVRIAEQIPVSEDARIQVKLVSPVLASKGSDKDEGADGKVVASRAVSVIWEGADEPEPDKEALEKNGKFNWIVALPAQGKVNLVLQYEVVVPAEMNVVGLA